MANKVLWQTESAATLLSTELNNVANGSLTVDAADYDNATNQFRYADFLFSGTFDAACNAWSYVELHIFYKLDGSVYGDGEDGDIAAPVASSASFVGIFPIGADAGPIFQQLLGVRLSPFAFRAAVKLVTGQDLTAADTHYVKMYPYNEEVQ